MMTMRLTNYTLDKYISQELSKLTECNAQDLTEQFDQAQHWIGNFILNSIFRVAIEPKYKPFIFGILRRAQMTLLDHENARQALLGYVNGPKERISVYFQALYHFEIAIMLLYQAYELIMKVTGDKLFKKHDGTPIERLNRIYNVSKHLEHSSISDSYLHSVWLSNNGICISTAVLSFPELADLIKDVGCLSDKLSNPSMPDQTNKA